MAAQLHERVARLGVVSGAKVDPLVGYVAGRSREEIGWLLRLGKELAALEDRAMHKPLVVDARTEPAAPAKVHNHSSEERRRARQRERKAKANAKA